MFSNYIINYSNLDKNNNFIIFFTVWPFLLYAITVSPIIIKNATTPVKTTTTATASTAEDQSSIALMTNLNQTERVRRLIPYMTFYVPTNDYLPINQAYNYMPSSVCIVYTFINSKYLPLYCPNEIIIIASI